MCGSLSVRVHEDVVGDLVRDGEETFPECHICLAEGIGAQRLVAVVVVRVLGGALLGDAGEVPDGQEECVPRGDRGLLSLHAVSVEVRVLALPVEGIDRAEDVIDGELVAAHARGPAVAVGDDLGGIPQGCAADASNGGWRLPAGHLAVPGLELDAVGVGALLRGPLALG